MAGLHRTVGWLIGLIALALSLLTLWHLMLMLSTQTDRSVNEDVPCCGRYLKLLLWNLGLLSLFVLQHSAMSSEIWKMALSHVGVDFLHRSLYVIGSCAVLHLIIYHMAVLPGPPLWYFDVGEYPMLWLAVFLLHCVMWFVICAGAVAAEPLELVGIEQVHGDDVRPKDPARPADEGMRSRHVGVLAFVVILWVHMAMSAERFLLAMVWTLYLLFARHRSSPAAVFVIRAEKKQT